MPNSKPPRGGYSELARTWQEHIRTWRDLPNPSAEAFEKTVKEYQAKAAQFRAAGDEDTAQLMERAITATCGLAEGWAHDTRRAAQ
jgi:hypothetical protein